MSGYIASAWGNKFHSRTEDEVLGAGAAGPGKTTVLIADILPQVQMEHQRCLLPREHKHYQPFGESMGRALHLRRTFPMLSDNIDKANRLYKAVDDSYSYNAQEKIGRFASGYQVRFGHCQHRQDWEQYMGFEFTHVAFDELIQFEEEQYEWITSRCRSSDDILRKMKKVRASSNPVGRRTTNENISISDPTWVRRMFVEPHRQGNKVLKRKIVRKNGEVDWLTRLYLPATLYDNPDPEFIKDYEKTLLGRPPHMVQALLYGNWWVTVGSFYADAWNDQMHVVRPFQIPKSWPQFRSMDWGFKTQGVVLWWAMDEDENLYCTREYTFKEKTDAEVAARVKEIEIMAGLWGPNGSKLTGPSDDQLWERKGDSSLSKAEVFQAAGVHWSKADKKSRQHNAERFIKRLKDHRNNTALPGIMFFNVCQKAIQTIPGIQTDPDDAECPLKGGEDHHHDAVLYACAYASRGAVGMPQSRLDEDDDEVEMRKRADKPSRGQYGYG